MSEVLLHSLDTSYDALRRRLVGLTDDEYLWQPAAGGWTVRPTAGGGAVADWADPDPEPAPVTTIAWRTWHIGVDCLDGYSARLFGTTGAGRSGRDWVLEADQARRLLSQAWTCFRAGVATWGEDGLLRTLGPEWGPYANHSNLDLALHAQREVVHHGAEIALLRDLYAATSAAAP